MKSAKYIIFVVVSLLFVAGCASTRPPETPLVAPTAMPTGVLPIQSPTIEVSASPENANGSINIGFVDRTRVVPASPATIDLTQPGNTSDLFRAILKNQSPEWPGGTITGVHDFMLEISLATPDTQDVIIPKFPIRVSVRQSEITGDRFTLVATSEAGGNAAQTFPVIPLQEGEVPLTPESGEGTPAKLSNSEISSVSYNFAMSCQQPGLYLVDFSIPYTTTNALGTQDSEKTYTVTLFCVQSAKLWILDDQSNLFTMLGNYEFQSGEYKMAP